MVAQHNNDAKNSLTFFLKEYIEIDKIIPKNATLPFDGMTFLWLYKTFVHKIQEGVVYFYKNFLEVVKNKIA